jgi:transcriptional regulator with XRE-family HTH domain
MTPGEELRNIRHLLGMSQVELEQALGYGRSGGKTVRDLEDGTTKKPGPALVAARLMLRERCLDYLPDELRDIGLKTLWELQRMAGAARISRDDYAALVGAISILRFLFEPEPKEEKPCRAQD